MSAELLKGLVDAKKLAIFLAFSKDTKKIFSLTELSKQAKVPVPTVMRVVNDLVALKIVEKIVVGKIKLYKLAQNKKTEQLRNLLKNG